MGLRWIHTVRMLRVLLIGLLAASRAAAAEPDTIHWLQADAPPFFILNGPLKGQGYQDVISAILWAHLPQYRHRPMTANVARHNAEFRKGHNVCTVGYYKTPERERFLYFSIPSIFSLPTVLVLRKGRFPQLERQGQVRLADLLAADRLRIGLAKDRSYGRYVDEVIADYGNSRNTMVVTTQSLSRNLFRMLAADRVDALLALPEEAVYMARQMGLEGRFVTLVLEENQKDFETWFSYVACSKTPWGKRVIEDVNEVLERQRPTEAYRAAYERWIDPGLVGPYRRLYETYFLGRRQAAEGSADVRQMLGGSR